MSILLGHHGVNRKFHSLMVEWGHTAASGDSLRSAVKSSGGRAWLHAVTQVWSCWEISLLRRKPPTSSSLCLKTHMEWGLCRLRSWGCMSWDTHWVTNDSVVLKTQRDFIIWPNTTLFSYQPKWVENACPHKTCTWTVCFSFSHSCQNLGSNQDVQQVKWNNE